MPWTRDDELAETMPCPASADHDAAERWVDEFLTRMRDHDHVIAVLCADDFATAGDL